MPKMNDNQIQEEFNSFALHLKDPDVIGDFKRLREIVTNEITIRQAALEEIENTIPLCDCSDCQSLIQIAGNATKGGE